MTNAMKLPAQSLVSIAGVALVGTLATVSAHAKTSTAAELRGYETCVAAFADTQPRGLTTPRSYYISKQAGTNSYFVNATVWEGGDRVNKRLNCVTSANGNRLQSFDVLDGRFAIKATNTVNVADR